MEIVQIVGYKNSGKTTLATTLIKFFSNKGIKIASLKHHGHGGVPKGLGNTDSEKHRQAGAILSGVEGEGLLQLSNHHAWDMDQLVAIYKLMNIEVLIMEGFKKHNYKKLVLVRDEGDLHLLEQLTNIKAVITPLNLSLTTYPYPIFKETKLDELSNWLFNNFFE